MTDTSPSLWDSWCLRSTSDKAKDTRLCHPPFINNLPKQNSSVIPSTHFCHSFSNSIAVVISGNIATWFKSLPSLLQVLNASLPSCYTSLSEKKKVLSLYFDISPSSLAVEYYLMIYGGNALPHHCFHLLLLMMCWLKNQHCATLEEVCHWGWEVAGISKYKEIVSSGSMPKDQNEGQNVQGYWEESHTMWAWWLGK